MLVKWLLLTPVALLAGWMVMAFWVVKTGNATGRAKQLTLGSIGEPDNLNPIISSTTSAGDIQGFVFNGLLKYDERINIVGDLAESYRLTQDSTGVLAAEGAAAAPAKLNSAKSRWSEMKLQSARAEGDKLILHFEDPGGNAAGTSYESVLFAILDRKDFLPTAALTVAFEPPDQAGGGEGGGPEAGAPASDGPVRKTLEELARKQSVRILEMVPVGPSLLGLSLVGESARFCAAIPEALKEVKGEVADFLEQALLNEPVIEFKLRPGVCWQDGRALTSADAAFTYRRILDPKYLSPRGSDYYPVKSVSAPDELTFVVRYRYPFSDCLSSWMMSLLPRHILKGRGEEAADMIQAVLTGHHGCLAVVHTASPNAANRPAVSCTHRASRPCAWRRCG